MRPTTARRSSRRLHPMPTEDLIAARPAWADVARRLRVPAAIGAVAIAAAVILGGPAHALLDALRRAFEADPRWVFAAIAFEALSFTGYVALLWLVAGGRSSRFGLAQSYRTTLAGAA